MDIPSNLLARGKPLTGKMDLDNVQGHFELVNYQLKQVRQLAWVVNRSTYHHNEGCHYIWLLPCFMNYLYLLVLGILQL